MENKYKRKDFFAALIAIGITCFVFGIGVGDGLVGPNSFDSDRGAVLGVLQVGNRTILRLDVKESPYSYENCSVKLKTPSTAIMECKYFRFLNPRPSNFHSRPRLFDVTQEMKELNISRIDQCFSMTKNGIVRIPVEILSRL